MAKVHYKILGVDCRSMGQAEYEFTHQAACGYVRDNVTTEVEKVTCKLCWREMSNTRYLRQ